MVQKKYEIAKKAIMDNCNTCHGHGCRHCISDIEKINNWTNASIPVLYWDYTLDTFNGDTNFKEVIKQLISTVDKLYADGSVLIFNGKYGVGKTWAGTELLKTAISKKYTAKYTSMSEIVNILLSKDVDKYIFNQKLLYSDLIFIDEVDSRFMPNTENGMNIFGTMMENIIRTRLQNRLPLILSTNNSNINEIFDGIFGQTFNSLFASKNIMHIPVGGIDLRNQQ